MFGSEIVASLVTRDLSALEAVTAADYDWEGEPYQITFRPLGEYPLTTVVDGGQLYRQLGTTYAVEVLRGG